MIAEGRNRHFINIYLINNTVLLDHLTHIWMLLLMMMMWCSITNWIERYAQAFHSICARFVFTYFRYSITHAFNTIKFMICDLIYFCRHHFPATSSSILSSIWIMFYVPMDLFVQFTQNLLVWLVFLRRIVSNIWKKLCYESYLVYFEHCTVIMNVKINTLCKLHLAINNSSSW